MTNYRDISLAKCKSHPFEKPAPKEYEVFLMEEILHPLELSDFINWIELKEKRMTTAEKIAVMQAYEDGKQIQVQMLTPSVMWVDTHKPIWDWDTYTYRIKPEPAYRPYKDTDEMIADYKERFNVNVPPYEMPLIWVKNTVSGEKNLITDYHNYSCSVAEMAFYIKDIFNRCTYLDGSPCGKLVEE